MSIFNKAALSILLPRQTGAFDIKEAHDFFWEQDLIVERG
jgi:hypothetical protein